MMDNVAGEARVGGDVEATPAYVVVPRRPGPLLEPGPSDRGRGETDDLLDALLGESTNERSGAFDLALAGGGAGLLATAALADLPTGVGVTGAALLALGLVLPVRDAWRALARRRARGRETAMRALGYPLDVSDPATRSLAQAYRLIVPYAAEPDLGPDAVEVAHLALVEVAGLLDGRPPQGAELEYVAVRAAALAELRTALSAAAAARGQAQDHLDAHARDAGVAAVRELDEREGAGSVARIDAVRAMLEGDCP